MVAPAGTCIAPAARVNTDAAANERMIREQIIARGVRDARVLEAMRTTPRELFVPPNLRASAYDDTPLPLARQQTISQPFIVARMSELLRLRGDENVLEIGTGSGYQTAVLARLASHVFSAEVEPELASTVGERLHKLAITNVTLGIGNGVALFRERAPFDAILSAAAPEVFPEELIEQLAEGGRCIVPVGAADLQYLWLVEKVSGEVRRTRLDPVRFVPLRG